MNPLATLLTTAAITAGSLAAARAIRKRMAEAPDHIRWLRKRRSSREDGAVIDLEVREDGVYGLKDPR